MLTEEMYSPDEDVGETVEDVDPVCLQKFL